MKKRVLAILCVLSILMGMVVMPATAATAASAEAISYKVGYAKVDLNPFINTAATAAVTGGLGIADQAYTDTDYVGKITIQTSATTTAEVDFVKTPLSGYGSVSTRLANNLTDDNGDGIVGMGDGVFATATSVTDNWGNTVIYITMDFLNGNANLTKAVRSAVTAELGIKGNQIMITGSHSHEAPNPYALYSSWYDNMNTANEKATGNVTALGTYWLYMIDQLTNAAVTAHNNATEATMSKGSVEAPTAMAAMGHTYSDGSGYKLNFVRNYKVTQVTESVKMVKAFLGDWQEQSATETKRDVFYIGDNFGSATEGVKTTKGTESGTFSKSRTDTRVTTTLEHATEGNQSMNLLQFTPTDGGKPIVMVEWRAHASNNGRPYFTNLSSDYVNALRYRLENNATLFNGNTDYFVGFWQGASGNNNSVTKIAAELSCNSVTDLTQNTGYWSVLLDDMQSGVNDVKVNTDKTGFYAGYYSSITQSTAYNNEFYMAAHYGYILGKVALYGLDECMTEVTDYGKIRAVQNNYTSERRIWPDGYFDAAYEAIKTEGLTTTFGYPYSATNGIVLNSVYHANAILGDYTYKVNDEGVVTQKTPNTAGTTVELNAIIMGSQVALVTSTGELFDNYNSDPVGNPDYNKWVELNDETYGTPFTLSYTNNSTNYVPNALAYDFPTNTAGTAIGSYEANTTDHAKGTGEALIDQYGKMLNLMATGHIEYECPEHGLVEWTPLAAEDGVTNNLGTGHYYLTEDMPRMVDEQTQKIINEGDVLCINLNGYTMETEGRSFNVFEGGEVSIIDIPVNDPGPGGIVRSYTEDNNPGGGLANVAKGGIFNLYGGTLEFFKEDDGLYGTGLGGIVSLTGTLNMYGGTIEGAELTDSRYNFSSDGCGGAIFMYGGAVLNMYGGQITSGTLPTTNNLPTADAALVAAGPCVYMSASTCKVNLYNDASVEDIYYRYRSGSNVTINGTYTGTTNLSFHSSITPSKGLDIGDVSSDIDLSGATLTYPNETPELPIVAMDTNLTFGGYAASTVAVIGATEYDSLQMAVDAYNGTMIKLIKNETNAVTVDEGKDVYLDLNGCSVGTVTVEGNYSLYCKDSKTDDYTVSDNNYGKIKSYTGNVKGIPEASTMADDGYLAITETGENGGTSFHRVNLDMSAMTLRPVVKEGSNEVCAPSVYYKSNFMGDEMVKGKVLQYGVALSVEAMPDENNIEDENGTCRISKFTTFNAGAAGNSGNGTLLKGVMKPTNTNYINTRNANMDIYGRAYIKLGENEYIFGAGASRTLKRQSELADGLWNNSDFTDAMKQGMVDMYNTYTSIVKSWSMPNLNITMGPSQDGALKVLVIGNSHGLDATNLLYEVFKDQGYNEQELVLGALYYNGCNMTQHASFMTGKQAVYDYYENDGSNANGSWNVTKGTVADTALEAHQWDIIILQQMNNRAGWDSTTSYGYNADHFKTVINYVKERQIGMPKFGWHMVWTNPDQSEYLDPQSPLSHPTKTDNNWVDNHKELFPDAQGNYSQSVMYKKIVECTKKYIEGDVSFLGSDVFDFVIPSATAVEYAQDVLGLTQAQIYRDYTHMNDYGRLIAAYTWYAKIMELDQIPAVGIDAIPAVLHHEKSEYPTAASDYAVTDDMKKLIRNAVNYALDNPYELPAEEDNTVSILGIGNSYTIDSMWMLGEVYQAENPGKNVQLGIAYKSGESLAGHVKNISEGNKYTYFYWDSASDRWTVTADQTLQQIIKAQNWEMVAMQQSSGSSGMVNTYNANIQTIQSYVEQELCYTPTYLWNMTWAYPMEDIEDNYTLETAPNASSFLNNYGKSQATMYKMIMSTVQEKILPDATFEYLMPVGTAIQNANGTVTDFELYRDYTHLSDLSRLMAAYTWYSELELTVLDEFQLKALPTVNCSSSSWHNGAARKLTDSELALAIQSVKDAMKDNFTTTDASVN